MFCKDKVICKGGRLHNSLCGAHKIGVRFEIAFGLDESVCVALVSWLL